MRPRTERDYRERMLRVLVHVQKHLDANPSLDELARIAHFSPFHFHRIFRGMVGESVAEHVRRLRLERAAVRLKSSREPVLRIALEAGYEAHESFTRAFGAMFGEPPSAFRARHGRVPYRDAPSGVHFEEDAPPRSFSPADGEPPVVHVRRRGPLRVAFIRHVGPYDEVAETWRRLMQWASARALVGMHMKTLGIPHDDPEVTPAGKIRYDAGLVVGDEVEPQGEVGIQELTAREYAVAYHRGPYEALGRTYALVCGRWLPASAREAAAAPALEFYLNSPYTVPPEDLYTEICIPLE